MIGGGRRGLAALLAFGCALTSARASAEPCALAALDAEILSALRARQFLDAHLLARLAATVCPPPEASRFRTYDAVALIELDEAARARETLRLVPADDEANRGTADVLRVWSYLTDRDHQAFRLSLRTLPPDARSRLGVLDAIRDPERFAGAIAGLDAALRPPVSDAARSLWGASRTKRPWLAGTLSAVVPGAGQAYAGSWQGAAVAFVLNAALIGASVELAVHDLYLGSAAAAVAASFFYVGNIVNAVDLARRRNEMAAEPARQQLERRLLPEAHP